MNAKDYNNAIDQYADNIFRFVLKHTRNKMLADDIVQETFAKVWEKHEDIQVEKAKSYLFTTAYHCLVDVMKKEARSGTLDGIERQGTQDSSHLFDIQKVLQEALERLPEIQKTVVLLRDYEGYHYDEIAEITGLTESQVKVYIFRARQTLKTYLKDIELVA
jgi:RNA polymerase sigma-70 factor (ECF subfamily)